MKLILAVCLLLCGFTVIQAAEIPLKPGMEIHQSVTITPGRYQIDGQDDRPVITISGENIVVDFNQAVLQGSNAIQRPDEFRGIAIRITKGSRNIRIKNAFVHGFAIAISADSVTALTINDCDLSYNKRQHLHSHLQKEDISDWMSYHHNENDEWIRYGAAIYLKNCSKTSIHDNTVTGGQCALMMTRCTDGDIHDNNFSFNSGIGIGLYRSTGNRIYHNRLDYNVRGYYDGQYNRGQDSAGILVFEQSSDNSFVYNTVTHSGDGFFLWAGQHTMDTGEGGCNDNFIFGNDFSDAPTNGIEVTFSRNLIMKNTIRNCWHGIWGGYSYDTDITDNIFSRNEVGIAIEHGQGINIALNNFTDDKTGIKLWSRAQQPTDWIYAQKRNTESRNYWIAANRFTGTPVAMDIMGTDTIALSGNTMFMVGQSLKTGLRVNDIDSSRENDPLDMEYDPDPRLKAIPVKSLPETGLTLGRNNIRITEWGPYNFAYPLLWLKAIDTSGNYHYEVLGPKGQWQIKSLAGFKEIEKGPETFPSTLTLEPDTSTEEKFIRLDYTGPAFTDAFGKRQDSGRSHLFGTDFIIPEQPWQVKLFAWDSTNIPQTGYTAFSAVYNKRPLSILQLPALDEVWWGAPAAHLPADSFATEAVNTMTLRGGKYSMGITADDYARVYVDGQLVIDAWDNRYIDQDDQTHHSSSVNLQPGKHTVRILHADVTGLATLQFYLRREGE